jgi:D-sedoheptulose 7-phosphate isomerase
MTENTLFTTNLDQHSLLIAKLYDLDSVVSRAINIIVSSMQLGNKLLICGNGGSAADSQHIAAEFTGRFIEDRKPLPAISLTTDTSALTCISNDYSYDSVFSRQVEAISKPGDVLMVISTSGNSLNLMSAVKQAANSGVKTIGLLGKNGGSLAPFCDCSIVVPNDITARIQEAHIIIGHTICGGVEQELGLVSRS